MAFSWINDNVEEHPKNLYEAVGLLAMIAGHPWKNLVRARGPVATAAWPEPEPEIEMDFVDGALGLGISSSPEGMIVHLTIDDRPWFEMRQENFESAVFVAYDWGDYFGMAIEAGGKRVQFGDAYNYSENWATITATRSRPPSK
jgi:hypothetical protein